LRSAAGTLAAIAAVGLGIRRRRRAREWREVGEEPRIRLYALVHLYFHL